MFHRVIPFGLSCRFSLAALLYQKEKELSIVYLGIKTTGETGGLLCP